MPLAGRTTGVCPNQENPLPRKARRSFLKASIPLEKESFENSRSIISGAKRARSARSTQVERALRARFDLWIRRRDGSGLAQFNLFTGSGGQTNKRQVAGKTPAPPEHQKRSLADTVILRI